MPQRLYQLEQERLGLLSRSIFLEETRFIFFEADPSHNQNPNTSMQGDLVCEIIQLNMGVDAAYQWLRTYGYILKDKPFIVEKIVYNTETCKSHITFTTSLQTKGF